MYDGGGIPLVCFVFLIGIEMCGVLRSREFPN